MSDEKNLNISINDDAEFELPDDLEADEEDSENEDVIRLQQQLEHLAKDLSNANNERLRAMADFQNFKRLSEQRAMQDRKFATERFVRELLPVLDNFERTLMHLQNGATVEQIQNGIEAVQKQLLTALESQQVKKIAALGLEFDPEVHEVIATEASDEPDGTIILEIESGYKLAERVIRPARVKVAKAE